MKPAKLIEIREENKIHDLTKLLSCKSKVSIGRRDPLLDTQADILLGEDSNGEPNFPSSIIHGISREHAVITYEEGSYYIQDCSTHGTTRINDERLNKGEKRILIRGTNLFFGKYDYGPVIFWQEF